jgi:hypothetical protein
MHQFIIAMWLHGVDYAKEAEYVMSNKLDLRTVTEWYSIAQPFIMRSPPFLKLCEECDIDLSPCYPSCYNPGTCY